MFAALLAAKSKGLDKIDCDRDGKIDPDEARDAKGRSLAEKIASEAARAATHTRPRQPPVHRPNRDSSGEGQPVKLGC